MKPIGWGLGLIALASMTGCGAADVIEQKTSEVNQVAKEFDQKAKELDQKAKEIDQKAKQIEKTARELERTANDAVQKGSSVVKSVWTTAVEQTSRVTAASAPAVIAQARSAVERMQSELASTGAAGPIETMRLAFAETQLARLDAAAEMQRTRDRMNEIAGRANDLPKLAEQKQRELDNRLAATNREYASLREQFREAKTNYDAATSELVTIRNELERLGITF